MAKSTEHPSVMFGTAGRAFHVLENEGVTVKDFLQRIIDQPNFRAALVGLYGEYEYFTVYDQPDRGALSQFISHIFAVRFGTAAHEDLVDKYRTGPSLRELMTDLTPFETSLFVMYFGLDDSARESIDRVAMHHRMTVKKVRDAMTAAEGKIRLKDTALSQQ